jgi:hypothetical protein
MIRTRLALVVGVSVLLAACGSPAASTQPPVTVPTTPPAAGATTPSAAAATTPAAAATTPAAAATTPGGQATPPPQGGGTVVAKLTGGATPGTFTGSGTPNCSFGFLGAGVWGVSFEPAAGDGVQIVVLTAQPGSSAGAWNFNANVATDAAGVTTYVVSNSGGSGPTIDITDNGATATIHIVGPTLTGDGSVDLTINCPSVTRV